MGFCGGILWCFLCWDFVVLLVMELCGASCDVSCGRILIIEEGGPHSQKTMPKRGRYLRKLFLCESVNRIVRKYA